jgi:FkbM family methyltransferase
MVSTLKKKINKSPSLKKLLLPAYLIGGSFIFWILQRLKFTISYSLKNKSSVKFYPCGQVAKGLFLGGFENKELEIFQSSLDKGSILVDAGANIGLYSIIGSRIVGTTGKVYAFEPSKVTFNLFLKNIELNKINNIIPINMGLGDKTGESLFLSQDLKTGDGEKYISKNGNGRSDNNESEGVPFSEVITLDTLDNFQRKNDIKKVDFLKIDVEGYEYYVLKGAENLIRNNPQIIILFECAEHLARRAGSSQEAVFSLLQSWGVQIIYWDEEEKTWTQNLKAGNNYAQLLGGRNILQTINTLLSKN